MFDNTFTLTRFLLRRERIGTTVWLVALAVAFPLLVIMFDTGLDAVSRQNMADMINSPAMIAMMGVPWGLEDFTLGAFNTTMMTLYAAITVGLMNILLVVRHTRADEEKGRCEVVRSLPVGRLSHLGSTMVLAVAVNVALSLLIALGLYAVGDAGMDFAGSLMWGVTLGASGLVFAGLAALFSQLCSNAGGAMGYSFGFMGLFFVMRTAGDVNADLVFLSYSNPLGLAGRTAAYVENNWLPVIIMLLMATALVLAAFFFNARRDIEQGVIPARKGRAKASKLLCSPFGLVFRLLRPVFILGVSFTFLLGLSYGVMFDGMDDFLAGNELYFNLVLSSIDIDHDAIMALPEAERGAELARLVEEAGFSINEMFAAMVGTIMALMALVLPLLFIVKMKSEEIAIRTELVLATQVSRSKYMMAYITVAVVATILVQLATAFGLYATAAAFSVEMSLTNLLTAQLVYLPAMWVMVGVAVLVVGAVPKLTSIIWGYFGFAFFVVILGRMPGVPAWFPNITPFGYIPELPVDDLNFVTLGVLVVAAVVLCTVGVFAYNKRDINAVAH